MAQQDKYYFGDGSEGIIRYVGYPPSSLKDFSEEKLDKIFNLYLQGAKITDIKEQFPQISNQAFDRQLPWVITDEKCEKCKSFLYGKYYRSSPTVHKINEYLCTDCGHQPYNIHTCECRYCVADREKEANAFKKRYYDLLNTHYKLKPKLSRLDVFDEIYLYLILSNFQSEKDKDYLFFTTFPTSKSSRNPSALDNKINQFIERELFIPFIDKFNPSWYDSGDWMNAKVQPKDRGIPNWQLNLYSEDKKMTIADYTDYFISREFSSLEKSMLWYELYKSEVSTFLYHKSRGIVELSLDGLITDYITKTMIEKFSLSKAFSFLYSAIKAAHYYQTKYNADHKRTNSFFKNKVSYYVNEYGNSKAQRGFSRTSSGKHSLIQECIIKQVLKLDNSYFYLHTEEIIPEYQPEDILTID